MAQTWRTAWPLHEGGHSVAGVGLKYQLSWSTLNVSHTDSLRAEDDSKYGSCRRSSSYSRARNILILRDSTMTASPVAMSLDIEPRNIYIIGPQSTGKTSLVEILRIESAKWIANTSMDTPQVISEVARTVLFKHAFTAEDITSSQQRCLALQQLIIKAQGLAENEALARSDWFISDRSGIDPLVYAKRYGSTEEALKMQRQDTWIELRARMAKSLIVVCESGTPWLSDDGVRLMPESVEAWIQLFHDFCDVLHEVGLQYSVVPKTMLALSERAEFVRTKWIERHGSALSQSSQG